MSGDGGADLHNAIVAAVAEGVALGIRQMMPELEIRLSAGSEMTGAAVASMLNDIARSSVATARFQTR